LDEFIKIKIKTKMTFTGGKKLLVRKPSRQQETDSVAAPGQGGRQSPADHGSF